MDVFDLFAKIKLDDGEFNRGLDDAREKAGGFGGVVSKAFSIGAKAIAAATTAVVAFAGASVKVGAEFDSSMSQVAATMGYTVDELNKEGTEAAETFGKLRDFAQEMGSTTAFSATQAADALNYMALAGYDAETSMEMLPNVLNLAAAGGIELAAASDMVTDAQSALGLSLDETTELVDKMATASSKSNTSVAQLGDAILTVGGTARSLKGGTTELAQVLGLLADNGIKGAEGGTALRNVVLSLSAPTDKAAQELKKLGVNVLDSEGNMRSLEDVFADLNKGLEGMSDGKKTQVLNEIFNKVDLKSVNALLNTNAERWDELASAIDAADGSAAAMADVQLDNLAGDITLFKSALEGAQIAISDGLTPDLRKFVQFGSSSISTLTTAFQEGGLAGAMDALGTILSDGIQLIITELPTFVDAGMELLSSLGEGFLNNLPVIIDAALTIIMNLAEGLIDNLPKVITAITDVVLAIATKLTDGDTVAQLVVAAIKILTSLATGLLTNIPKLIAAIPDIIASVVQGLIDAWPEIQAAGADLLNALIEGLDSVLSSLLDAAGRILNQISDGISAGWQKLKEVGKKIIDGILQGLKESWDDVKKWFSDVVGKLKGKATVDVDTSSGGAGKAIGMDYVPFNNYPATLHRGEAVLTRAEAEEWRSGMSYSRGVDNARVDRIVSLLEDIVDNGLNANISRTQLYRAVGQENRTRTKATNYNALAAGA